MNEARIKEVDDILISIIIATFNAEKQIGHCIQSIVNLAQKKLEIIIVDGAGTDNTKSIVEQFSDENIIWTSGPDKGIYDALNKGIKIAKGKWFYFMGADDRLLPGFSELASCLCVENAVYYGDTHPFYHEGKKPGYELLSGKFSNYRLAKYCINHQAIFYPATVFIKYNYDLKYKIFADYALNLKALGRPWFSKDLLPNYHCTL